MMRFISVRSGVESRNFKTKRFLKCFYDPKTKDWDRVIREALAKAGAEEGKVTVICYPKGGGCDDEVVKHPRQYKTGVMDGVARY